MSDYVQNFNERLIGHFESKAQEFNRFSEENNNNKAAPVAKEIAGLYRDLAELMKS